MESLEMNKGEFSGLFNHVRNSLQVSTVSPILDEGIRRFAEDYLYKDYSYDKNEIKDSNSKLGILRQAKLISSKDYRDTVEKLKELEELRQKYKRQAEIKSLLNDVIKVNPDALFLDFDSFSRYIDDDENSKIRMDSRYTEKVPEGMVELFLNIYKELNDRGKLHFRLNQYSFSGSAYITTVDEFTMNKTHLKGEEVLDRCNVFYYNGNSQLSGLGDHPVLSVKKYIDSNKALKSCGSRVEVHCDRTSSDSILILTNSLYVIPFQLFQEGVIVHGIFKRET